MWIKKRQFNYDDVSQFGLDKFMLSGFTVRMKISVIWKNSLDKRDNIDWINTITRRKLISGFTVRMKISVIWKNSLDKRDNIDWINTITRRNLIAKA